jgi:hypothetical protein
MLFEDTLREREPLPMPEWRGESYVLSYAIGQLERDAIADAVRLLRNAPMDRDEIAEWDFLREGVLARLDALTYDGLGSSPASGLDAGVSE